MVSKRSRGGGKYVTVVEGEADALAVSEMFDNKWAVVSIRSGASGAVKDIKANLEWLETFENVVICFDNDKAGQEASRAVLDLFTPNKAKNVVLPMKDAGEMLKERNVQGFIKEWWNAKTYQPRWDCRRERHMGLHRGTGGGQVYTLSLGVSQ